MYIDEIREFCLQLPYTSEKLPFDDKTLVFYISNKMFCLTDIEEANSINVKCDPEKAIQLREEFACVLPGYHMNKTHWNTIMLDGSVGPERIKEWIKDSYNLVWDKIPLRTRQQILNPEKD